MSSIAIKTENLSKKYRIGVRESYKTFREFIVNSFTAPLHRIKERGKAVSKEENIWALKDFSFEIKHGDVVGIIGSNGAGKSTLLKILSRITRPTEGRAIIKGRIASLLEVGTGFHPELTGHENIYLNGAILGMDRYEISRKFDEIVAFAEIEKFLETPVKKYSSGMYVRLAFAVAAHLEPEILLVDEVLAVGDIAFQKKCLGKIEDISGSGRTVLFVSHNISSITRLCNKACLLESGRLKMSGETNRVVSHYLLSDASQEGKRTWENGIANLGVNELKIKSIFIKNNEGEITSSLDVRLPFWIEIEYQVYTPLPSCRVGIIIFTVDGITVFQSYDSDDEKYMGRRDPGTYINKCTIPGNFLNSSRYLITIYADIFGVKRLAKLEHALAFDIIDTGAVGYSVAHYSGIIRPKLDWHQEKL